MTWIEIPEGSGYGLHHLPYGSIRFPSGRRSLAVRVGDSVLDLRSVASLGLVPVECESATLDRLLAASPSKRREVREVIRDLVVGTRHAERLSPFVTPVSEVGVGLPFTVGDFVDFYASEAHASNVGRIFRPGGEPLTPNWKHLPIGYHGRSGTVMASGSPVVRPRGQIRQADGAVEVRLSDRLDFEIEMGWVVGGVTPDGHDVTIADADERVFGFFGVNDWSARDIQAFESVPLGPFLGKSFATSVGAWVTPLEALAPYRVSGPRQDPEPASYLRCDREWAIDIELVATISSARMRATGAEPMELARVRFRDMYWTTAQQFAHMTVNGASVRPGDMAASGTISGWEDGAAGCLLERTRNGEDPFPLPDGTRRTYLEDGDEVSIRARTPDGAVELGEVSGRVVAGRVAVSGSHGHGCQKP